ncbi:hypothetical protein LIER_30516 [Lithospermum erythrorhizon]|uniref:Uncharacterized protein n=1 Tax=Lithospermum erythrorhizon TaxID=34254 RepID=A0AAV3RR14_LITER
MVFSLCGQKVLGVVDGTLPCPYSDHPQYNTWVQCDDISLSWFTVTLSTPVLKTFLNHECSSSHESWLLLQKLFLDHASATQMQLPLLLGEEDNVILAQKENITSLMGSNEHDRNNLPEINGPNSGDLHDQSRDDAPAEKRAEKGKGKCSVDEHWRRSPKPRRRSALDRIRAPNRAYTRTDLPRGISFSRLQGDPRKRKELKEGKIEYLTPLKTSPENLFLEI